jgi:2-keto-4-pentenoate hydratase/2-oxohepta-3-ene-1,7-dioic acid hydratase in catechol pathway
MKLLSFSIGDRTSYGALKGEMIVDLGQRSRYPTLRAALAAGALSDLAAITTASKGDLRLKEVTLLTPVPDAEKVIGIGVNYKAHIIEVGRKAPEQPSTFIRLHSSVAAPGMPIIRPKASEEFDYEGELAFVIGKGGRNITRETAFDYVAGYTCFNDGSIRNYQLQGSVAIGKNFSSTGSIGPWMVTIDEIPDVSKLQLETRINGKRVQHTGIDDLLFDVPAIIAYVSAAIPLTPGDIISTGTPSGVAMAKTPPTWLKPGDVVEIEISNIGVLRNPVAQEI